MSFIPDTLVFRDGYTLGYSSIYRQTLWVVYPLTADNLRTQAVKRLNRFYPDPDLPTAPHPEDYIRSGYDRGHLVPAADMAYSDKTMRESFYMGNISPQIPSFNRKTWKQLENEVRKTALREQYIYILTGAIFHPDTSHNLNPKHLIIPTHYYKVILDPFPFPIFTFFIYPHQ